jgi:hypothetical protein
VLTTAPPRLVFGSKVHRCFSEIKVRGDRGGVGRV